jgi:hypothetical protein
VLDGGVIRVGDPIAWEEAAAVGEPART